LIHTTAQQQKSAAKRESAIKREAPVDTKIKDNGRKWLWGFLAVLVMSQFYVAWELLAAFTLFALVFATIAFAIASLFTLQYCWKLAIARFADIRQPVTTMPSVSRENREAA
jgi:hypothetical protein